MAVGSTGMLATSNYAARKFGVRAAMPGFIARKPVLRIRIRMFLGLLDPDPDPFVTSQIYGSGFFYHQAKIVRKPLTPSVLQCSGSESGSTCVWAARIQIH